MSRFNGNYIENPEAYAAAVQRRIKANASKTRRAKLLAAIEQDGAEFRAWLLDSEPAELEGLRVASGQEFHDSDCSDARGPAYQAYQKAFKAWHARTGALPEFLREALENWGGLTDGQLAFARKIWAERLEKAAGRDTREAARRASAQPWTAGRQEVTGVVQSARWETFSVNRWASSTSLKALILLADGRKIWTTLPSRLHPVESNLDVVRGSTVTLKVTIEVSKDDPTMAFGKRPS